ncbi:MAG: MalY/PatB family protein [Brevinema sp.]
MDFDYIINRLGTYCTQWDYVQDRFGKAELLPFTISDMDIRTAPNIITSLQKRLNHGIFGYTRWDQDDYKNSIKDWYQRRFYTEIEPSWIVYSPNVMYAVASFLRMIDNKKQGICLINPCYDGFITVLNGNKFPIHSVDMKSHKLDWNILEQQLAKSKIFLLCNPNNPNGHLWTREELICIVELCKKYDVFLLSDDIHMDFVYKPFQMIPVIKIAQELDYLDHTLIISAISKTFNLSGLGGAYIICPNLEYRADYMEILKNRDCLSSALILHITALMAGYQDSELWVEELCQYFYGNLQLVHDFFLANPQLKMSAEISQATYFSWIDCSQMGLTSTEIQDALINKGGVAIMDGDRYCETLPFLRMNIACPRSKVQEGLQRIKQSF